MRFIALAIIAILLFVVPASAAPPSNRGQLFLDNTPRYHEAAQFHWRLDRKPRWPTLGVFCSQNGFAYIAELGVTTSLTGLGSVIINNETSSAMPGKLDYTKPADCQAFMWDERLVDQGKPSAISNQVFFTITN